MIDYKIRYKTKRLLLMLMKSILKRKTRLSAGLVGLIHPVECEVRPGALERN